MSDQREHSDHALSRIYREGAWPEPSRQIDEAILAASRRAARERWPLLWRWAPPFALAATVVVTGSLVLMHRERPDVSQFSYSDAAQATVDEQPAAPLIEKKEKAAPAQPPAPPPPQVVVTPQGYTSTMDAAEAERIARAQRDLGLKQSPPASESPVPVPAAKAALAENYRLRTEPSEPKRSDAPQRQPELQASNTRSAPPRAEQPAGATTLSVFGAPPPAQAQAPAPTSAPAPAPVPAFAPLQAKVQPQAALRPAPQAISPPSASNEVAQTAAATERSPLTWLDDIRRLKAEGKAEEAARELAEFRKRHPDYPLPNDLR